MAQIRITSVDKLPLGTAREWHAPEFSPDGRSLFLTTSGYDGIWQYDLMSRALVQITASPRSGYGFAVSPDGKQVVYRRSSGSGTGKRQELIVRTIASGAERIAASGREVSPPTYGSGSLSYAMESRVVTEDGSATAGRPALLGIENTKIALLRGGKKILLDPLGKGSYIWPVLSPDGTALAAVDMSRGAFVCDVQGRGVVKLGRANAPSWMRGGGWLVYMDDRDDGHRLLSSDLYAVDRAGKRRVRLTSTPDRLEMYPRCSPAENRIVCSTPDGSVFLYVYEEAPR
jgi:Tol biopolymer transport system component